MCVLQALSPRIDKSVLYRRARRARAGYAPRYVLQRRAPGRGDAPHELHQPRRRQQVLRLERGAGSRPRRSGSTQLADGTGGFTRGGTVPWKVNLSGTSAERLARGTLPSLVTLRTRSATAGRIPHQSGASRPMHRRSACSTWWGAWKNGPRAIRAGARARSDQTRARRSRRSCAEAAGCRRWPGSHETADRSGRRWGSAAFTRARHRVRRVVQVAVATRASHGRSPSRVGGATRSGSAVVRRP